MWNCDGVCMLLGVAWWWWYIAAGIVTTIAVPFVFDVDVSGGEPFWFPLYGAIWPITIGFVIYLVGSFLLSHPKRIYDDRRKKK